METPEFLMSTDVMTETGIAGVSAAIGMSEPVTTNFSSFTSSSCFLEEELADVV